MIHDIETSILTTIHRPTHCTYLFHTKTAHIPNTILSYLPTLPQTRYLCHTQASPTHTQTQSKTSLPNPVAHKFTHQVPSITQTSPIHWTTSHTTQTPLYTDFSHMQALHQIYFLSHIFSHHTQTHTLLGTQHLHTQMPQTFSPHTKLTIHHILPHMQTTAYTLPQTPTLYKRKRTPSLCLSRSPSKIHKQNTKKLNKCKYKLYKHAHRNFPRKFSYVYVFIHFCKQSKTAIYTAVLTYLTLVSRLESVVTATARIPYINISLPLLVQVRRRKETSMRKRLGEKKMATEGKRKECPRECREGLAFDGMR